MSTSEYAPESGAGSGGPAGLAALLRPLLETAVNRGFAWLDPDTFRRLGALEGKVVAVRIAPTGQVFWMRVGERGIELLEGSPGRIDVTIESTPQAFVRLLTTAATSQGGFPSDVTITGDVTVAEQFRAVLGRLNVDWEEQLSRIVGDIAAHELARAARSFRSWAANARETLLMDAGEYLCEELRLVPARGEIDAFVSAVDILRDDAARLEKRIQRLQRRAERGG